MIAIAAPAAADHSLQAVATLSTGYTDNVQLVPDNADPTVTAAVTSDAFANISPGMIFAHEGHRITQVLRYTLSIRLYAEQSGANSFSNSLNYGGIIPLTPRAGMTFDITGSHGRLNAFDLGPQNAQAGGQAQGDQSFATGSGTLGYSYQLTPSWSYGQTIGGSIYEPLDESVQIGRRTSADASLSLGRTFNFNSVTFSARGSYSTVEAGDNELGVQLEDTATVIAGPELRWVHDLSTDFSTDASGGVTVTFPPDEWENRQIFPVGAFYLRYVHDRYAASLGYRRTVLSNLQLGETTATHVGEARGVIPLPFGDTLSLEGAVIYSNGESVGREDQLTGMEITLDTIAYIGDVALGWRVTEGLSSSLRYQYTRQNRDSFLDPGEVERTRRQQIMLTLEGTYPSRQAVELPRDSSTRVDGGLESMSQREESLVR